MTHTLQHRIDLTRMAYMDELRIMHRCQLRESRRRAAEAAIKRCMELIALLEAARLHHVYTSCAQIAYAMGDQNAVQAYAAKADEVLTMVEVGR